MPVGKLVLFNSQDVIAPEPVILGTSGKSLDTMLFVSVTFSGVYVMSEGSSSLTVRLKYARTEPPELFAHTLYAVLVHSSVAVPYNVPLALPKDIPAGKRVLFSVQDVIAPDPVIVGARGRSELAVLFVKVRFSGEYEMVGSSSTTVMLR